MTFQHPSFLVVGLLPALAAVVLLAIRTGGSARRFPRALPFLVLSLLLIVAAAGPGIREAKPLPVTIVYAIDISDSTAFEPREEIHRRLAAIREMLGGPLMSGQSGPNIPPLAVYPREGLGGPRSVVAGRQEGGRDRARPSTEAPLNEKIVVFGSTAAVLESGGEREKWGKGSTDVISGGEREKWGKGSTDVIECFRAFAGHVETSSTNIVDAVTLGAAVLDREALRSHVWHGHPGRGTPRAGSPCHPFYLGGGLGEKPAGRRELVILTDGRVDRRELDEARRILREHSIQPIVVPIGAAPIRDAAFLAAEAPATVRVGEPFDARLYYLIRGEGAGSVSLFQDSTFIGQKSLPAGANSVVFEGLLLLREGGQAFKVKLDVPGDEESRNNVGFFHVEARGRDRIAIISGTHAGAGELAAMLGAAGIEAKNIAADEALPQSLADVEGIVLWEIKKDSLSENVLDAISAQVEENGVGLLSVLGPAGPTWHGTEFLPVAIPEPSPPEDRPVPPPPSTPPPPVLPPGPKEMELPSLALFVIIDKSGSMAGERIQLAKEGAIAAAETLKKEDTIAVIAFDAEPRWVVTPTSAGNRERIESFVARLMAGGGTNLYPALQLAHERIKEIDARIKHFLILTDGHTPLADYRSLMDALTKDRITVSCIGVGEDFDSHLLGNISKWGRGAFYFAIDPSEVPQIFTVEVERVGDMRESLGGKEGKSPSVSEPPLGMRGEPGEMGREGAGTAGSGQESGGKGGTGFQPVESHGQDGRATTDDEASRSLGEGRALVAACPCQALKGLEVGAFPVLRGQARCESKRNALTALASGGGLPVLVYWRYGAGSVAVWTSSFSGAWAPSWEDWSGKQRLLTQLIRFILPVRAAYETPSMTFSMDGKEGVISADLESEGLILSGEHVMEAFLRVGNASPERLPLRRSSLWRFSGRFPIERFGRPHHVEIRWSKAGEVRYSFSRTFYPPCSGEIASFGADVGALRALAEGAGGVIAPSGWGGEELEGFRERLAEHLGNISGKFSAQVDISHFFLIAALLFLPVAILVRSAAATPR